MPQLIVALDSVDESANYIHIDDVKDNVEYYCPCCKGIIKPRAYKKDINYQVQPHFYHEMGGCNEETFVHYICKTWLFEKGCKFMVNNTEHEVEDILSEKTLRTSFGDYRPDIIVTTISGKIFYFEIKTTNRKTEHYIPKWDELGNDVVEVDTRYFINQKYKNDIPMFNLIYSNGECFIKTYTRNEYDTTIAQRKLQWKRQDKLNYKIQWERLDWFWNIMQEYKQNQVSDEDVICEFVKMDYSDKIWCFDNLKNKSCVSLKEKFREHINSCFFDMLNNLEDIYGVKINCNHKSPLIYIIYSSYFTTYLDYKIQEYEFIKIKLSCGRILSLDYKNDIEKMIIDLNKRTSVNFKKLKDIGKFVELPYIKSIKPISHWASDYYSLDKLYFKIEFADHVHNKYIKEPIGVIDSIPLCHITENNLEENYLKYKKRALNNLDFEFLKNAIKNDLLFWESISLINDKCDSTKNINLKTRISKGYNTIALLDDYYLIFEFILDKSIIFGKFEPILKNIFETKIDRYFNQVERFYYYVNVINSCKNRLWHIEGDHKSATINLYDGDRKICCDRIHVNADDDDIKNKLYSTMSHLLLISEQHHEIRFLEEEYFG